MLVFCLLVSGPGAIVRQTSQQDEDWDLEIARDEANIRGASGPQATYLESSSSSQTDSEARSSLSNDGLSTNVSE